MSENDWPVRVSIDPHQDVLDAVGEAALICGCDPQRIAEAVVELLERKRGDLVDIESELERLVNNETNTEHYPAHVPNRPSPGPLL